MAIDHINQSPRYPHLQSKYIVSSLYNDPSYSPHAAEQQIGAMRSKYDNIVAMVCDYSDIGGGNRTNLQALSLSGAQVSAALNASSLPVLSPFNTTSLIDTSVYTNLHQFYPADAMEARVMLDIMLAYGFTSAALVLSDDVYGDKAKAEFLGLAQLCGVTIYSIVYVPAVPTTGAAFTAPLRQLYLNMTAAMAANNFSPGVVFAFVTSIVALDVFSAAYSQGTLNSNFIWMISSQLMNTMQQADLAGRTLTDGMLAVSNLSLSHPICELNLFDFLPLTPPSLYHSLVLLLLVARSIPCLVISKKMPYSLINGHSTLLSLPL